MSVCYYHVTCAFQSKSTLYGCQNVKELLARSKHDIWWSLSGPTDEILGVLRPKKCWIPWRNNIRRNFQENTSQAKYHCRKSEDHGPTALPHCRCRNGIRTRNYLVRKQTLNHSAKMIESSLATNWLRVQILMLSLNLCRKTKNFFHTSLGKIDVN